MLARDWRSATSTALAHAAGSVTLVVQVRGWLDMLQEVLQGTMAVTAVLNVQLEALSRAQVHTSHLVI